MPGTRPLKMSKSDIPQSLQGFDPVRKMGSGVGIWNSVEGGPPDAYPRVNLGHYANSGIG